MASTAQEQQDMGDGDGGGKPAALSQNPAGALPPAHAPSVAGSVIEASDGLGGTNFIRIQNISSTGTFVLMVCWSPERLIILE